jgi:transposase
LKQQRDLLVSIQGIGKLTAAKLIAEYRDFRAFRSPKQLVAFAGLNPKQRQSGSSVRGYTAISRMRSANIRAALFMPAIVAKQHNPLLRTFAKRLEARGVAPKAIVVAIMRKLLHLVFGILKSGQPFDPHFLDQQPIFA